MENEGRLAKLALRNADGAGDLRSQAQSQNHMTLGDISLLIPVGERIDDLSPFDMQREESQLLVVVEKPVFCSVLFRNRSSPTQIVGKLGENEPAPKRPT